MTRIYVAGTLGPHLRVELARDSATTSTYEAQTPRTTKRRRRRRAQPLGDQVLAMFPRAAQRLARGS